MEIVSLVIRKGSDRIERLNGVAPEIIELARQYDRGHKKLVFCRDQNLNFEAFVAVHDITLGPGLGGCRVWNYRNTKDPRLAAIKDALLLSEAMTYKNSSAGLDLGGGKAVLLKSSRFKKNRPEVLRSFGRFVEYVGGYYITAEDMGATPEDMIYVSETTRFATGTPMELGGSGNSSFATAVGILEGIRACCDTLHLPLAGLTIAVQGACGHVAVPLLEMLSREGVSLVLSEIPQRKEELEGLATKYNASIVKKDTIYDTKADIFSPCAMGEVLNDNTIPRLKAAGVRIVAGAANNQLEDMDLHGVMIRDAEILYAPDFIINSGGVINIAQERAITGKPYSRIQALIQVKKIYDRLLELFAEAKSSGVPTAEMARHKAVLRINKAREARNEPPLITSQDD